MLVDRRQVAHDHAAAQQVDPRGRRGVARNRKGLKRTACYEGVLIARAFGVAPSAPAGPRGCGRANRECGCWSAPAVRHARGASRSAHPRARAWSSTWVRALQKGRATQQVTKSRVAVCRSFAVACQRRGLAQLGLICVCVCQPGVAVRTSKIQLKKACGPQNFRGQEVEKVHLFYVHEAPDLILKNHSEDLALYSPVDCAKRPRGAG